MEGMTGVVLAAGQGKRMKSRTPKVLHRVCGKELIRYPVDLLQELGIDRVVVVVSPSNHEQIREVLGDTVEYVVQPQPLGTGDALECCAPLLGDRAGHVLAMGGDSPLVRQESVERLLNGRGDRQMAILTGYGASLHDLGRIIRRDGKVRQILEAAETDTPLDGTTQLNAGVYCLENAWLWQAIGRVEAAPSGERYLTSLARIADLDGVNVETVRVTDATELWGVNNRLQLAEVEAIQRQSIREHWMTQGVTLGDPPSVFIDAGVTIGMDTVILPNTMLLGDSAIGDNCEIGPGSVVQDSRVGDNCRVTLSVLEEATMEDGVDIGPFSHLRPEAYLETGVHLGNFVEVKESRIAAGSKMGHFGYVGDASIGANVNIGAGMVTCNYDGVDKHRTIIEDGAFIGCDTMLVAPVTIGAGAVTGAGAVVIEDVPPARLAVGVPAKIKKKTN